MITAVKGYLTDALVTAGVPAQRITDDPLRRAEWPPPQTPYAELLTDPESIEHVNRTSARTYDAQTGQATTWTRLMRRSLPVRVRLVHRSEADLDALMTTFLGTLTRAFRDGSQTIVVTPLQTVWAGWRNRPNDREQAVVRIQFMGGVYRSEVAGTLGGINLPVTPAIN